MNLRARTGLVRPALSALALASALACSGDRSPMEPSLPVYEAKGGAPGKGGGGSGSGGPVVSAADPSSGHQGDIQLEVRVLGSGFDETAAAVWERDGAADPKVVTRSTRFVSSTEVVATLDIAFDAALDLYDIAVYIDEGRKKGVGLEKFTVEPGIVFLIPTSGFGVTSDGAYAADGVSEYAPAVCAVSTNVFRGGSGDAILHTKYDFSRAARKCPNFPRELWFTWPDAPAELIEASINVGASGGASGAGTGGILAVPVGEIRSMPMNIHVGDAAGASNSRRCESLKFRRYHRFDPSQPSNGGQDVLVYREDSRTWHVSTPVGLESTAECTRPDGSTEPINLSVSFRIVEP